METWLKDEISGIECGINGDGILFFGDKNSGYNLRDTPENRDKIINDFCSTTGRNKPVIAANGAPIKYEGSLVEFSR